MMQSAFISIRSSRIHYTYAGKGQHAFICFHGFGEEASGFEFLEGNFGNDYTIIAIDLPYHGKTNWEDGLYFHPDELVALIEQICVERGLKKDGITLMGYSLGGRVVLKLYELLKERIAALLLVAPDGLHISFWYWLATGSALGRRLFAFTMNNPGWLRWILEGGRGLKLVNQGIYKFARHFLQDNKIRQELYTRWVSLRGFQPDLANVKSLVQQNPPKIGMVFGRYDRIIPNKHSKRLTAGIDEHCRVVIVNSGHYLMHEKNADLFAELLHS